MMRRFNKVIKKVAATFFPPGGRRGFVDGRGRYNSPSFTLFYKSKGFNQYFSSSVSSSGGCVSFPAAEWIDPFLDVSDVVAVSPTNHQQQFQPSPWLSRVIDILLQHDDGVDDVLETRLDSLCGKFLIKLSPFFVSQVLKSSSLRSEVSIRFFRWAGRQRGFSGHNLHSYIFLIQNIASSSSLSNTSHSSPHLIVRELLNEIKHRQLSMTPSASTTLIRILGARDLGMMEELLLVWRLMKESGVQPSIFTYNCLLDALVNSMFFDSAEKVFHAMLETVGPDVVTYNIMIKGYCKAGKIQLALDMFRSMNNKNNSGNVVIQPDKITYMTLIQAHYSDGDFDSCFQLYLEMEEKGLEIPVHAYSLVISGLCKTGKPLQAHSVFDNMRKTTGGGGNVSIYTALIDSFAKCGNEDQAIKLFETMKVQGLKPDEVTYGVLINCLCKSGKLDKALEWFRFCQNNSGYSDTAVFYYTSLIDGFGKAGKVDDAEKLFEEMVANGSVPDAYCYNALIDAFCKTGNINQAMTFFKRMETDGCDQTVYTYTILLDGLFRRHKNEEALKLWCTMIDKGITPTPAAFRTLSTGLCLSGKVERACRILDELAPMGVFPDTAYQDMINVLCKAGRIHQVCKLADEIVDKGRETPARVRTIFINALRKAGNAELAIKLLHSKVGIGYDRYGSVKRRVRFLTLSSKVEN